MYMPSRAELLALRLIFADAVAFESFDANTVRVAVQDRSTTIAKQTALNLSVNRHTSRIVSQAIWFIEY